MLSLKVYLVDVQFFMLCFNVYLEADLYEDPLLMSDIVIMCDILLFFFPLSSRGNLEYDLYEEFTVSVSYTRSCF